MKTYSKFTVAVYMMLTIFVSLSLYPTFTYASSSKPSCLLSVETSRGETTLDGSEKVLLIKNEEIKISWESTNAKKAFTENKLEIKLNGTATASPKSDTTYSYFFENGSKKVTCEVAIIVVEGSIGNLHTFTDSAKPKIGGTAKGTKLVQVNVIKKDSTKPVFVKKNVKVTNGKWSVTLAKKLKNGEYTVTLLGAQGVLLNTIATSTLQVGLKTQNKSTTFVAELVPLLVGGQARSNTTIPMLFLQVINIGTQPGTITGFEVHQNGSAQTDQILELAISNEVVKNGFVKTEKGKTLFKNNTALIPVSVTIPPQQMQLFTLKTSLGSVPTQQIGKQLQLNISSITTDGKMQSAFPILGTTWVLVQ